MRKWKLGGGLPALWAWMIGTFQHPGWRWALHNMPFPAHTLRIPRAFVSSLTVSPHDPSGNGWAFTTGIRKAARVLVFIRLLWLSLFPLRPSLVYAHRVKCRCGERFAYDRNGESGSRLSGFWACSRVLLTGSNLPEEVHSMAIPFVASGGGGLTPEPNERAAKRRRALARAGVVFVFVLGTLAAGPYFIVGAAVNAVGVALLKVARWHFGLSVELQRRLYAWGEGIPLLFKWKSVPDDRPSLACSGPAMTDEEYEEIANALEEELKSTFCQCGARTVGDGAHCSWSGAPSRGCTAPRTPQEREGAR